MYRKGEIITTLLRMTFPDKEGKSGQVLVSIMDITERKHVEEKLKFNEERLNLTIRGGSNDAPWDWDLIKDELFYSEQWWHQVGYEPNELLADASLWQKLMHPDDQSKLDEILGGALKNDQESYAVEFRLLHKQGHYVPVLSRGFVTRDNAGKPVRVTGTNMDLTERKQAEKALQQSEEKYRSIFENSALGIFRSTSEGRYEEVNKAFAKILGFKSPQEMIDEVSDISKLYKFPQAEKKNKNGIL